MAVYHRYILPVLAPAPSPPAATATTTTMQWFVPYATARPERVAGKAVPFVLTRTLRPEDAVHNDERRQQQPMQQPQPRKRQRRGGPRRDDGRDDAVPSMTVTMPGAAPAAGGGNDSDTQEVPSSQPAPAAGAGDGPLPLEPVIDILSVDSEDDSGGAGAEKETLHCTVCGKGYKHNSCLSKHQWEHHELWGLTRSMCLSKHQQVQLMEAARALLQIASPDAEPNAM